MRDYAAREIGARQIPFLRNARDICVAGANGAIRRAPATGSFRKKGAACGLTWAAVPAYEGSRSDRQEPVNNGVAGASVIAIASMRVPFGAWNEAVNEAVGSAKAR